MKELQDWKEVHADVYSKFKQDLEEQLLKPYHQTILDLGDGNAEPLQSVITNFAAKAMISIGRFIVSYSFCE